MVGAGALGCAAARTLARAASAAVTLVDDDVVELSNLQRQVLYRDEDLGRLKVDAAEASLARDFGVAAKALALRLDAACGPALVASHDIVLDATDDPASKFLIGRLCVEASTPYVYAGVARTGGQWMLVEPGASACLECVFPPSATPGPETAEGCSAQGILAPVAGVVGAMQAWKALAFLETPALARAGRLHLYELAGARSRHVDFPADARCFCREARRNRPANFPIENDGRPFAPGRSEAP